MGFFDVFRENGGPTQYGPQYTPVTEDVLVVGLLVGFGIVLFSAIIVLPGIRGKESLFAVVKVLATVFFGAVILVSNYGYGWQSGSVHTKTFYKVRNPSVQKHEIDADIGLHVGLRGINVTLKGTPIFQWNEVINYNERFSWEWNQGRLGFGPYAGRISREFRAGQYRGLPLPILAIVEYFTLDGEKIRWGRCYREAGYYTHIMLWTAVPLYVLSLLFFKLVLSVGALFLALTGCCLLLSNILFSTLIANATPALQIPFDDNQVLKLQYGWSYFLVMVTGILCILQAAVVIFMDYRFPRQLAKFFSTSVQDNECPDETDIDESNEVAAVGSNSGHHVVQMGNSPTEPPANQLSKRRFTSPSVRPSLRALRRLPSSDTNPTTNYLRPGYVNITLDENGMIKAETPTSHRPLRRQPTANANLSVPLSTRKLSDVGEEQETNQETVESSLQLEQQP